MNLEEYYGVISGASSEFLILLEEFIDGIPMTLFEEFDRLVELLMNFLEKLLMQLLDSWS